jgi:hypothetical protein
MKRAWNRGQSPHLIPLSREPAFSTEIIKLVEIQFDIGGDAIKRYPFVILKVPICDAEASDAVMW